MGFLFDQCPGAQGVVMGIGALTAIGAATIGFAQNDIKKVLAYSTVSQLGFMFMAVGAGAYWVAIFHVMTHAFFKACLFLGSGSVIMGCHHEQDIRKMGGLKQYMKWTYVTFGISSLALAGVPPLSGFFSKDEILWQVFNAKQIPYGVNLFAYVCGLAGAFCTAFYMTRLVAKTFWGDYRGLALQHSGGGHDEGHHGAPGHSGHDAPHDAGAHHEEEEHHGGGLPKESPWTMVVPLVVLMLAAIGGGFVGLPHAMTGKASMLETWLDHTFQKSAHHEEAPKHEEEPKKGHEEHGDTTTEFLLMGLSVVIGLGGIFAGLSFHQWNPKKAEDWVQRNAGLYEAAKNKYYVDEFYEATFIAGVLAANQVCARFDNGVVDGAVNAAGDIADQVSHYSGLFDNEVVDGAVNGVADVIMVSGQKIRTLQTGNIKNYLTFALVSALAIIAGFSVWSHWEMIEGFFKK
jgi:NADH-quinone oxidoreductase subunit L